MAEDIGGMPALGGMGGRDLVQMLLSEAKRRPELQALCDRASTLTDEEIATAAVPLAWHRKALSVLRDRAGDQSRMSTAALFASKMGDVEVVARRSGKVVRYTGPDRDLRLPTTRVLFPVKNGELMFLTGAEWWIGAKMIGNIAPQPWEVVCDGTQAEYRDMISDAVLDTTPGPKAGEKDMGLFRITKL